MDNTIEDIEFEGKRERLNISSWDANMIELTIEINQDLPDPTFLLHKKEVLQLKDWIEKWISKYGIAGLQQKEETLKQEVSELQQRIEAESCVCGYFSLNPKQLAGHKSKCPEWKKKKHKNAHAIAG